MVRPNCCNEWPVCKQQQSTEHCVTEPLLLIPSAESIIYLSSNERHQQPSAEKVWQRGLLSTGLPARLTQPTQKSKQIIFLGLKPQ